MDWLNASKAATATVGNSWPDVAAKLDTTAACFHAALHSVVNVSFGVEGTLLRRTTRTLEGAEAVSLPTISASCVIVGMDQLGRKGAWMLCMVCICAPATLPENVHVLQGEAGTSVASL